jgi:osmoprotectant transport system ATP-binding protein
LASPADDFVASFVGADRGLKRLSLTRLADLELDPPPGAPAADGAATASEGTSLRDALSLMLTHGGRPLVVLDVDGRPVGTVTVDMVSATLSNGGGRRPAARA